MNMKLEKLENDFNDGIVRICFGSKDLFQKQFHLEENGITFKQWKKEWEEKELPNLPLSAQKTKHSGTNRVRMM